MNYFKIKKIKADLAVGRTSYEELERQHGIALAEHRQLVDNSQMAPKMQEAAGLLDKFYAEQGKQWADSEYSKEDIVRDFTEEHLASLSEDDFAILLKRYDANFVTNVVRGGLRAHGEMQMFHNAGMGEYSTGFKKMLAGGRLRSPLGVKMMEGEKEEAIAKYLKFDKCENRDQAQMRLNNLASLNGGDDYADRSAIHFATEFAADHLYGSEKGNEVAVVYPSAYIASQYHFSGPSLAYGDGSWQNDQWVYANEERGMDLNAGLVFIPGEARVDPKTGSRYELTENMEPIINTEYRKILERLATADDFVATAEEMMLTLSDTSWAGLLKKQEKIQQWQEKLKTALGITNERLIKAIISYDTLCALKVYCDDSKRLAQTIQTILEGADLLYQEKAAEATVSSQEFWEKYFKESGVKKPNKIVYYKGTDLTTAIKNWRIEQGIEKRSKDDDMGFPERRVTHNAPEANVGIDRFRAIAQKIFDERYPVLGTIMVNGQEVKIVPDEEFNEKLPPDPDDAR